MRREPRPARPPVVDLVSATRCAHVRTFAPRPTHRATSRRTLWTRAHVLPPAGFRSLRREPRPSRPQPQSRWSPRVVTSTRSGRTRAVLTGVSTSSTTGVTTSSTTGVTTGSTTGFRQAQPPGLNHWVLSRLRLFSGPDRVAGAALFVDQNPYHHDPNGIEMEHLVLLVTFRQSSTALGIRSVQKNDSSATSPFCYRPTTSRTRAPAHPRSRRDQAATQLHVSRTILFQ